MCEEYDYSVFTKSTMRKYIRSKRKGNLFACNQCDFKNARKDEVNIHKDRIHEGVVFRCERCDLVLTTKGSLRKHNLYHHSDKKF